MTQNNVMLIYLNRLMLELKFSKQ